MELCLHSPPVSDSKDHKVAPGSCTSYFYNYFLILQNGVFYGIVVVSSLINCKNYFKVPPTMPRYVSVSLT